MPSKNSFRSNSEESKQIEEMKRLTQKIEKLSKNTPDDLLPEIQMEVMIQTVPLYLEMGHGDPTQAQLMDVMIHGFKLSIEMLEEYWWEIRHRD